MAQRGPRREDERERERERTAKRFFAGAKSVLALFKLRALSTQVAVGSLAVAYEVAAESGNSDELHLSGVSVRVFSVSIY